MTAVIIDDEPACHDSLNLLLPGIEPPIEVSNLRLEELKTRLASL